jgi:Tfp pilus assembly protein PilF
LVKNNIENKKVIDKYQITNDNILSKIDFLSTSGKTQDLIAAADICNLVGRVDLSMQFYQKVVSLDPTRGKVWMVLGRTELRKADQANSNPYLAAIYLENAIKNGWGTWESYSYLALAYLRTGQLARTKEMVKKEMEIEPNNPDVKKWQEIIAEEESKLQDGNK